MEEQSVLIYNEKQRTKKGALLRILVVEDEAKIASFIKRGLKEEGYVVDVAPDGDKGYFLATTNDYDLILLDVMIPKIDGFELCQKLRKEGVAIPVIMLTAKEDVKDKVQGLDRGADDYVTKPFEFEELLARIRVHMRRRNEGAKTAYQVDDLTLDLLAHKVERAGKPVILTTKEYTLLEYLMRHAGQIVTRTMLAEHVWDVHFDPGSNVIDVYINYLRNKIDGDHEKKLIHTVRGRGYTLKE
jgi:heavy metal response regulator